MDSTDDTSKVGPQVFGPYGGSTYGTAPNIPYAPHTGLDSVVSSSDDTFSSDSGLGALAALTAGAAGLGLTALYGKNKDKDDEDDDEKEKDDSRPSIIPETLE